MVCTPSCVDVQNVVPVGASGALRSADDTICPGAPTVIGAVTVCQPKQPDYPFGPRQTLVDVQAGAATAGVDYSEYNRYAQTGFITVRANDTRVLVASACGPAYGNVCAVP